MKRLILSAALLGGCASIDVQSLDPTLQTPGKMPGIIYYLPSPYLLVMELPPTQTTATVTKPGGSVQGLQMPRAPVQNPRGRRDDVVPSPPEETAQGPGAAPAAAAAEAKKSDATADGAASPTPSTTTSFQAATPQYIVKLIYFQDRSRPMSISTKTGLFGNTALKLVLQDGWMLTSLDASAETKGSEALSAVTGFLTAAEGGGTAKAVGTAAAGAKSAPGGGANAAKIPDSLSSLFTQGSHILRPGLYAFDYDSVTGVLKGLKEVSVFTGCGVRSSDDALLKQMLASAGGACP